MAEDGGHETAAIRAALAIIHELARRPGMSRHEKLDAVSSLVSRAMDQAGQRRPVRRWPEPSVN